MNQAFVQHHILKITALLIWLVSFMRFKGRSVKALKKSSFVLVFILASYVQLLFLSEGFAMSKIFPSYEELMKGQEPFIISVSLNHDGSILLLGFNVEWNGREYIAKYDIKNDTIEIFDNPPNVDLINPHFHPTEDWFAVNLAYDSSDIRIGIMDIDGNMLAVQPSKPTMRRVIEDVAPDGRILYTRQDMSERETIGKGRKRYIPNKDLWEMHFSYVEGNVNFLEERQITAFKGVSYYRDGSVKNSNVRYSVLEAVYINGGKDVLLKTLGTFSLDKSEIENEYENYPIYIIPDVAVINMPIENRPEIFNGKATTGEIMTDIRFGTGGIYKSVERNFTWDGAILRSLANSSKLFVRIRGENVSSLSGSGIKNKFTYEVFQYSLHEDALQKVTYFKNYFGRTYDASGDDRWVAVYSILAGTPKMPSGHYPEKEYALRLIDTQKPLPARPDDAVLLDIKPRILAAYHRKFDKEGVE